MKKIGVLTSGGDAPGMNACIRAVVRAGIHAGLEVYGVRRGYYGLVNDELELMNMGSVSDIIQRGGTILYTARCPEFKTREGMEKAYQTICKHELEGLIVIGGDGSFRGATELTELYGIQTIGIPGTIDNDLGYTDYTLGFDTAVNTVVGLINNIRDTMTSHERVSVVEVMGRNCGDLALFAGVAGGAEVIAIPEIPIYAEQVVEKIRSSRARGKKSNIIVVAEGVKNFDSVREAIEQKLGLAIRTTVLGHIQRGGAPSMQDRILASKFGYHAIELLEAGKTKRVIGIRDNKIVDFDILEVQGMQRPVDAYMYNLAKILAM